MDKKSPLVITSETIEVEVYTISSSVKLMTEEEKIKSLKELFQREYQGKSVVYDKEGSQLLVETNKDTKKNFFWKKPKVLNRAHRVKIDIGANGDYFKFISNVRFVGSSDEDKPDQSNLHRFTKGWHYFKKSIICENALFDVLIDVREDINHKFSIHNISLFPPRPDKQKEEELILPDQDGQGSRDKSSSIDNIPHAVTNVNEESEKSLINKIKDADEVKELASGGTDMDKGKAVDETER